MEDSWSIDGEISVGRSGGYATVKNQEGDVLVIGGFNFLDFSEYNIIDKYDAQTGTWTTLSNLPEAISGVNATLLENGEIIVVGGQGDDGNKSFSNRDIRQNSRSSNSKSATYLTNVFSINTETGVQTTLNPITNGRAHANTFALPDNRIMLLYGRESTYYDNGVIYGTATSQLTYNITFHIYESDGVSPINEASVNFNSETFITDAFGEITFNDIESSNGLPFNITKIGYDNYHGSASINSNDIDIYVNLQIATVINPISSASFIISPNPSSGIFTITNYKDKITNLEIIDITGKTIKNQKLKISNSQSSIDISDQPGGVYFLKIQSESGIYTKKIIKN